MEQIKAKTAEEIEKGDIVIYTNSSNYRLIRKVHSADKGTNYVSLVNGFNSFELCDLDRCELICKRNSFRYVEIEIMQNQLDHIANLEAERDQANRTLTFLRGEIAKIRTFVFPQGL